MINELLDKEVSIEMGISMGLSGMDGVKGKILEIDGDWLKLLEKKMTIYVNLLHLKRIIPKQ